MKPTDPPKPVFSCSIQTGLDIPPQKQQRDPTVLAHFPTHGWRTAQFNSNLGGEYGWWVKLHNGNRIRAGNPSVWIPLPNHSQKRTPNAFTVGNKSSYDRDLRNDLENIKWGRCDDYKGGWVWRTAEDAQLYIDNNDIPCNNPHVYGLILPSGWDVDVSYYPEHDGVHRLLNDAQILALDDLT